MVCGDKRMKCSGAHIVDRMNVFLPNLRPCQVKFYSDIFRFFALTQRISKSKQIYIDIMKWSQIIVAVYLCRRSTQITNSASRSWKILQYLTDRIFEAKYVLILSYLHSAVP